MVEVRQSGKYTVLVVGCGGTGSQLLSPLLQFCNSNTDKIVRVTLIDADLIEEKNKNNQRFVDDDMGQNKASVLARRYSYIFDKLTIESYEDYITNIKQLADIIDVYHNVIIIGCVDNNATRKVICDYIENTNNKSIVYIDSGNGTDKREGQIVTGYKRDNKTILKNVGQIFSDVRDTNENIENVGTCMRISEGTPQNIATNLYAASNIFNVFVNAVMLNKIENNIIFFNADKSSAFVR